LLIKLLAYLLATLAFHWKLTQKSTGY